MSKTKNPNFCWIESRWPTCLKSDPIIQDHSLIMPTKYQEALINIYREKCRRHHMFILTTNFCIERFHPLYVKTSYRDIVTNRYKMVVPMNAVVSPSLISNGSMLEFRK